MGRGPYGPAAGRPSPCAIGRKGVRAGPGSGPACDRRLVPPRPVAARARRVRHSPARPPPRRSTGWLGEDVWMAHCVHMNDSDIEAFARTRTGV
ncbi:hypothetical protein ACISU4_09390, partial [Streptomyces wuyuanensis]|uniref:hypothetical protein n=1 Tax=Streptomyces wuyuanensis TaxID=1196353 RepID=UPI003815C48D